MRACQLRLLNGCTAMGITWTPDQDCWERGPITSQPYRVNQSQVGYCWQYNVKKHLATKRFATDADVKQAVTSSLYA